MEQQSGVPQAQQAFIKTVCTTQVVYTLKSNKGYATSRANEYEDEEGNASELMVFWSDSNLAAACAVNDWKGYKPEALPLAEFMESWCVGMYQEDMVAGLDFNATLTGAEAEPLVLIMALLAGLKAANSTITFVNYSSIDDFSGCIKEALA